MYVLIFSLVATALAQGVTRDAVLSTLRVNTLSVMPVVNVSRSNTVQGMLEMDATSGNLYSSFGPSAYSKFVVSSISGGQILGSDANFFPVCGQQYLYTAQGASATVVLTLTEAAADKYSLGVGQSCSFRVSALDAGSNTANPLLQLSVSGSVLVQGAASPVPLGVGSSSGNVYTRAFYLVRTPASAPTRYLLLTPTSTVG